MSIQASLRCRAPHIRSTASLHGWTRLITHGGLRLRLRQSLTTRLHCMDGSSRRAIPQEDNIVGHPCDKPDETDREPRTDFPKRPTPFRNLKPAAVSCVCSCRTSHGTREAWCGFAAPAESTGSPWVICPPYPYLESFAPATETGEVGGRSTISGLREGSGWDEADLMGSTDLAGRLSLTPVLDGCRELFIA
ncbi:hypothetical protein LY76DRAFT_411040 [Colletotrichum caudatum]|nr:hypothetical protein LY76DRAFT_411040 [Colletotrichum caudatum]